MKRRLVRAIDCVLHFARRENGGALAELAILVPFLVIMLAAVAEFGRYFENYTTLAKATRASARYLSNHTYSQEEQDRAKNLVACGQLAACGTDKLVKGIDASNVCIEYFYPAGSPKPETVTVSIPYDAAGGCGAPYTFTPVFDIGALLHNSFSLALPISPSTTMYYMLDN